ncbi:MAG: lytic transglycosylase domain-containing protein [Sporomusaceae bacterium]|nr:lytic transglycosylase domain-containing protein [Sporomusaceae bacterium]
MIGEVIKEYLVSLGVQVDKPGFNQMQATLNQTDKAVAFSAASWAKDFIKAGTLIGTALAGVTASVAGVMTAAAKQDLAMEKYARSMLVSKDAAAEMKMALDALDESIQDVQLTPELLGRYRALVADGRNMKVGGDYDGAMRELRDIVFEFTRLKQEANYALQWVGYYLAKHLGNPLRDAKANFKSFNDDLIKNMPAWTEKAARALVYVVNIGKHYLMLLKAIGKASYAMWDSFPAGVKVAIAALTALALFIKASPVGRFAALIGAMLLLVDDYYGYMEGKEAAMGPLWDKLNQSLAESEKHTGRLKVGIHDARGELRILWAEFEQSEGHALSLKLITDLLTLTEETLTTLIDLSSVAFTQIGEATAKNGVLAEFKDMFYDIGVASDDVLVGLTGIMKQLGLLSSDSRYKSFWSWFGDELSRNLKRLANFGSLMAKLVQLNWAVMNGEFKKAGTISRSLIGDVGSIVGSYFDDERPAEAAGRSSWQGGRVDGLSEAEAAAEPYIQEAAKEFNLDPNLLRGLVKAESSFDPDAGSPVGARGYAQLMPETAKGLGVNIDDPRDNIRGGAMYLREQLDTFNGNVELALAAYNAGPGAVKDYKYTIPPYEETRNYVPKVLSFAEDYRNRTTYTSSPANAPSGDSFQKPPDGMRDLTWVDRWQEWLGEILRPSAPQDSETAANFVRPTSFLANAFTNTDPMIVNSLMRGSSPAYAQGLGGSVTNITYQVEVGGVEVKSTNASAEDIGKEVGNKTASSIHGRAEYFKMNRVLNGVQS